MADAALHSLTLRTKLFLSLLFLMFPFFPPLLEETFHDARAFLLQDTGRHLRTMIEHRIAWDVEYRFTSSGSGIGTAVNHAIHAAHDNGTGTHLTRF